MPKNNYQSLSELKLDTIVSGGGIVLGFLYDMVNRKTEGPH